MFFGCAPLRMPQCRSGRAGSVRLRCLYFRAFSDSGRADRLFAGRSRLFASLFPRFMNAPVSPADENALLAELAQMLVDSLNLDMKPAEIDPDAPLYGDGLGLDSIDILEVALAVSKKYGFQLRAEDENKQAIYSSLRSLARHIAAHRTI